MRRGVGAALLLLMGVALWLSALAATQALDASCVEMRWDRDSIAQENLELALENAAGPMTAALYGVQVQEGLRVCHGAGDLTLLAGGRVLYGHMDLAQGECAVSRETAWALLGAEDVRGRTIELEGRIWLVRGVYAHGQGDVVVAWRADSQVQMNCLMAFAAGWPLGDSRRRALDFAAAMGLSQPEQVLDMPLMAQLAQVLAMLPGWALAIYLAARQIRRLKRGKTALRLAALGLSIAAMAWALKISMPPSWLLPTRWSDFAFWQQTIEDLAARVGQTLSARHYGLDRARIEGLALAGALGAAAGHLLVGGFRVLTKRMEE